MLKDNKQEICAPFSVIQEQGMDLDAILKEYTTMMRKKTSLAPQKTFKSESDTLSKTNSNESAKLSKARSILMQGTDKVKQSSNLITAEEKMTGEVKFSDYRNYLSYSMGLCGMVLYMVVCTIASLTHLSLSLRLADWAT